MCVVVFQYCCQCQQPTRTTTTALFVFRSIVCFFAGVLLLLFFLYRLTLMAFLLEALGFSLLLRQLLLSLAGVARRWCAACCLDQGAIRAGCIAVGNPAAVLAFVNCQGWRA